MNFLTKIFGSKHDRDVKKMQPIVDEINQLYEEYASLSDEELKGKTTEFRTRIAEATDDAQKHLNQLRGELDAMQRDEDRTEQLEAIAEIEAEIKDIERDVLDEIHPEAFAVFKETCRRFKEREKSWDRAGDQIVWHEIPYDVQLIGATVLHQGKIAEMATGEGKTLAAGLALYLNGLLGRGVHLVTVNSYLAKRDAMWLGPVYLFLGLTVGVIQDRALGVEGFIMEEEGKDGYRMRPCDHKDACLMDIVYGTKDQFGFDYLYDNMAIRPEDLIQREHYFAIIDEVDSILIDEARTPLIISGPVSESSSHRYEEMRPLVEKLVRAQTRVVNNILKQAEEELESGDEYEAGILLLQVQRGMPKNSRFPHEATSRRGHQTPRAAGRSRLYPRQAHRGNWTMTSILASMKKATSSTSQKMDATKSAATQTTLSCQTSMKYFGISNKTHRYQTPKKTRQKKPPIRTTEKRTSPSTACENYCKPILYTKKTCNT